MSPSRNIDERCHFGYEWAKIYIKWEFSKKTPKIPWNSRIYPLHRQNVFIWKKSWKMWENMKNICVLQKTFNILDKTLQMWKRSIAFNRNSLLVYQKFHEIPFDLVVFVEWIRLFMLQVLVQLWSIITIDISLQHTQIHRNMDKIVGK